MASGVSNIRVLRGIIRELRHLNHKTPLRDTPAISYIIEQYRKYQVTGQKVCKGHNEMQHIAETYLCLLESSRMHQELTALYKGQGERTIEESARLVGLNVPNFPEKP